MPLRARLPKGAAVAVAAATLALAIAGCGSSAHNAVHRGAAYTDGVHGTLPPAGRPLAGGTLTVGQLAGQTPTEILPLPDAATCSTQTLNFIQSQYVPLYAGPVGVSPRIDVAQSAARLPVYSDGDRTVTIRLRRGLRWSDGRPVTAQDVLFDLALIRAAVRSSPLDWCQYSPGQIPDNIASATASGPYTVVLHLTHPVNPGWFTLNQLQDLGAGVYPLPSQEWNVAAIGGPHLTDWATNPADALRIYRFLAAQGTDAATFASSPLWRTVDGPFRLRSFDAATGSYTLSRNPSFGLRPRPRLSGVSFLTYASHRALLAGLRSGRVEIATLDPSTQLRAIPALERTGYAVFGAPGWGWFGGVLNFKDAADGFDRVIAQPYIRGVLAELLDQRLIIKDVYDGWAVPARGPVPTRPRSPYLSAAASAGAWRFDPRAAVLTLRAHGWKVVPGGRTTCLRPGSGPRQCGRGIAAGTPISLVWANVAGAASIGRRESLIFAREARRVAGIEVRLTGLAFSALTADFDDQSAVAARYQDDWAVNNYGGVYTDYYPTQAGLLSSGGALNLGAYTDPRADRLMSASVSSPSRAAVGREVSYLSRAAPILYMPDADQIVAVSDHIGGPRVALLAMTQQQYYLGLLYRMRPRR